MTNKPFPETMYAYLDDDEGEYFLLEEKLEHCLDVDKFKPVGVYTLTKTMIVKREIKVTVVEQDLPLDK